MDRLLPRKAAHLLRGIDTRINLDMALRGGYPADQAFLMLLGLRRGVTRDGARLVVGARLMEGASLLVGIIRLLLQTSSCFMNVARCRSLLVSLANKLSFRGSLCERARFTDVA